jgi:hypothetical protein
MKFFLKKNPPLNPHPKLKKEKEKSRHVECMLLSLLPIGYMKLFISKTVWSPFLAWANTPQYKLGGGEGGGT